MTTSIDSAASSELLEIDAEIQRLARLLNVTHAELHYLRELPSAELRELRAQVIARLYDGQGVLANLAAATKILPLGLTVSLAEKVFGPMLAARIAGLIEVDRAVELAVRLPVPFLAQVATELDPRRVGVILGKIPPQLVAAVTRQLVEREEWVAMGTLYAYLPAQAITAAIAETDAHALLQIALVLDDKTQLARVMEIAGADTLAGIVAAAECEGYSEQLQALAVYLTPEQQAQLR